MIKHIGVDVGHNVVRFAVLEKIKGEYFLKHKQEYPGELTPETLRSRIANFLKEHGITRPQLYFTLPHDPPRSIVRFFDMPILPLKAMNKSMAYEIEEKTVIDTTAIFHCWDILRTSEENYSIVAAITRKDLIRTIKESKKNWTIKSIEPRFVSFGRLIENGVVIDFDSAAIFIYKDNLPVHVHVFEPGVDLSREINRSLRSYEAAEGFTIDKVYYAGHDENHPPDSLSTQIDVPFLSLAMIWGDSSRSDDSLYAAAVGACLDIPYLKKINFLYCKDRKKPAFGKVSLFLLGLLLATQAGLFMQNRAAQESYRSATLQANQIMSSVAGVQSSIQVETQNIASFEQAERVLQSLIQQESVISYAMQEIAARVPPGISLTSIYIRPNYILIEGRSDNYSEIGAFAITLEELGSVVVNSITGEKDFRFEIFGANFGGKQQLPTEQQILTKHNKHATIKIWNC